MAAEHEVELPNLRGIMIDRQIKMFRWCVGGSYHFWVFLLFTGPGVLNYLWQHLNQRHWLNYEHHLMKMSESVEDECSVNLSFKPSNRSTSLNLTLTLFYEFQFSDSKKWQGIYILPHFATSWLHISISCLHWLVVTTTYFYIFFLYTYLSFTLSPGSGAML